jgi:hypothetical protein
MNPMMLQMNGLEMNLKVINAAQISKKIKNVFDIGHAQNKLSSFQHGSKRRKTATCQKFKKNKVKKQI